MAGVQQNTGQPQFYRDFFTYEVDFFNVAPGDQRNGQIQIQADSDFVWERAAQFSDIAGAAQTIDTQVIPLATVQVTDVGSGRQLMQVQIAIPSLFGNGTLPNILPEPHVFRARSSVNVAITNFSAATTYAGIRLSFIGTKVFVLQQ